MNPTIQRYLLSSAITFFSTFLTVIGGQLAVAHSTDLTTSFWLGIGMVAGRAAIKALIEAIPTFGRIAKGTR